MERLKSLWVDLTARCTQVAEHVEECWVEIENAHSGKDRTYHNYSHLQYMLSLAQWHKGQLQDADSVFFSIFYHDIVYSVIRKDNEEKSAEVAGQRLAALNLSPEQVARIKKQIIATKSHKLSADNDTNYLLDFDLAILGDTPENYLEYTRKVRKEYSIYPDLLYNPGRKKMLQHFLAMDQIFKTTAFLENHEQQARQNLQFELEQL